MLSRTNRIKGLLVLGLIGGVGLTGGCDRFTDSRNTNRKSDGAVRADSTQPVTPPRVTEPKTAVDQSNRGDSIQITAALRRSLVADSSMSTAAQNCTIITDASGVVTLRGVVDSQAEKDAIDAMAKGTTGVTRVINELTVKQV